MSKKLRKALHRHQFKQALKSWLRYLDEEKPWGMQTFSWNGSPPKSRKTVERILKAFEDCTRPS